MSKKTNEVMETLTVGQAKRSFAKAAVNSKGHNKIAYKFALTILKNLDNDMVINARRNLKSNTYNIGDIGEIVIKSYYNDQELSYSVNGTSDLNRERMNEIKTYSASNRPANGLLEPQGFIALTKHGVHYINKSLVMKYWNETVKKDNRYQFKTSTINYIIENEKPNKLQGLTEYIFG